MTAPAATPLRTAREERVQANDATAPLTLEERILAITNAVQVKATGKSPFSKEPAVSIEDIEAALRPLLGQHKIHIRFRSRGSVLIEKGTWQANVEAIVRLAEADTQLPHETGWIDPWDDTGGTPAAAYSFARKSYLKQLFHIADKTEDTGAPTVTTPQPVARPTPEHTNGTGASIPPARVQSKPRVTVQWTLLDRGCPDCGDGTLRVGVMPDGKSFIGCTNYPTCKHTEQVPREGSAAAVAGDVDPDTIPF